MQKAKHKYRSQNTNARATTQLKGYNTDADAMTQLQKQQHRYESHNTKKKAQPNWKGRNTNAKAKKQQKCALTDIEN